MDFMKKLLISLTAFCFVFKIYPGIFSSYEKKAPEENIQDLSIEQINSPTDPYINYNLGVALYQTQKYEAAKNNFERAVAHSISKNLKERSLFNLANSCYKNALSILPVNWEDGKNQIDPEKLNTALEETKTAIKNYESVLDLSKENLMAKTNLKKAKELLEKLNKKKQDKQDQKQQKDSPETKPEQQQEQKPQESEQQKDQNKSQDSPEQEQKGQKQDSENKQEQSDKKQDPQHDKTSSNEQAQKKDSQQEQSQDNASQQQDQMQESAQIDKEKESAEQKAMRSMLENLQNEEENLQKAIIQRQTKDQKPLQSGQKPW
jgi:hypothetical protein